MAAMRLLSRTEGIIPAIETAHALAGTIKLGVELGPDATILVNLSGRGDKDMETAAKYFDIFDTAALTAEEERAMAAGSLRNNA
jgi:tryptophan synthase beta chain